MGSPPKTAKPQTQIVLADSSTDAGAMERLFLLEAYTPAYVGTYDATQNLAAMRLMRQTEFYRRPGAFGVYLLVRLSSSVLYRLHLQWYRQAQSSRI